MSKHRDRTRYAAIIADAGRRYFRLLGTASGPEPMAPTSWDGPLADETLTVLVEHSAMAEDVRYAPFPYTARVRVEGSIYGNTPVDRTLADPTHNRITVVTVTEDTTLGRNTRVGDPAHRERSFRPGWQPMHVFTQPGTYNVVTYVYDQNGKWGKSAPLTLVVTGPLDKIALGDRIILSNAPGETWADAPPHDVGNRVTTLNAAIARLASFSNVDRPHGVFIKRGTVYDTETGTNFTGANAQAWGNHLKRAIVTTWGTGARPVLDPAPTLSYGQRAPVNFDGIKAVYNWDRQAESYKVGREDLVASASTNQNGTDPAFPLHHFLFNDCDISDTAPDSQVIYRSDEPPPGFAAFFNDCLFQDLGDYISLGGRRVGFLNSTVRVSPGAATGHMDRAQMSGRATDFGQSHNSMRGAEEGHYIDGSYMEGRGGWSGSNGNGMTHDHQALLRANPFGGFPGQRNHIARSVMVGDVQIGGLQKNTVESSVMVYDPAMRNDLALSAGAMDSVRNCHFLFVGNPNGLLPAHQTTNFDTDAAGLQAANFQGFVRIEEKNIALPFQLVHNSFTVHRNTANLPTALNTLRSGPTLTVTTVESGSNVTYAPDHGTAPSGGVTMLDQPWDILDVWVRVGWERQTYILPTNLAPGATSALIAYPLSLTLAQLTQADFAGQLGRHAVRVPFRSGGTERVYFDNTGTTLFGPVQNGCDIVFEAGGFRVVNTSVDTWLANATMRILLDRGRTLMAPLYYWTVPTEKVRLFRPTVAQAITLGAPSALFEFSMRNDRLRPAAGFAISPAGTNTAGAILPAVV